MAERMPVDGQAIAGARLDDLDLTLVQRHLQVARDRRRYATTTDPLDYLVREHAVVDTGDGLAPTLAGILAFSPEPDRWVASSGIDVAQFKTPHPSPTGITFMEQVRGSIFQVIDRTVAILWDRTEHGYHLEGAQRVADDAYPEVVLRELTVNAVCHRDWSQEGSRIRIQMFPDRIEWISPGSLPHGVTIHNLRVAQRSRNRIIAHLLHAAGYVEEFGIGIDVVFDTLRATNVPDPRIEDDGNFFTFSVMGRIISAPVPNRLTRPENERHAAILAVIEQRGPLTIRELAESVSASRRTLQRDLQELVEQGYLRGTGATSNYRYRLTALLHD
ncbi:MAG: hypothetical protein RLZZ387_3761 [Chloroflexota bacterium]